MQSKITRSFFGVLVLLLASLGLRAQTPASNLTFSNINTTSMTISWTNGTGAGRLVVLRAYPNTIAYPVDFTNYSTSLTFGNGSNLGNLNYCVYKGTATAITVTNLSPQTYYYVTIFEYTGTSTSPDFNISSYASSGHYTLATSPTTQATGYTATNLAPTTATISWTPGNGTYTLGSLRSGVTNNNLPTDATSYGSSSSYGSGGTIGSSPYAYVVYNGSGSSVNVSGLSPQTNYVATGFSYNGPYGGSQNYYTSSYDTVGFTTLATEPTSTSSYLDATDITDDAMTLSWLTPASGGGTYHLVLVNSTSANDVPLDASMYTANSSYGLGSLIGSSYVVYAGTGNAVRVTNLPSMETTYTIRVFEFNGGAGTFNATTNYLSYGASTYQTTNTTHPIVPASNMTFSNITSTSVQVNWTNGTGQQRIVQAKAGRRQTALAFDGVNDHVVVGYNSALQPTTALTLECWVYRANWATSVATQYYAGNAENGGYCLLHSGTYLYSYVYRNGTWGYNYTNVAHLTPGWHHLAMTYDGRYIRSYIDGAYYNLNDAGATYPVTYAYSNAFIIGADVGTGSTTSGSYANCSIDEVRVWSTAMYQYQIQGQMYESLNGNESNLAGYWKLDDGISSTNTAANSSLTTANLNGILTNMTTTAASSFTGTSGWINSNSPVDLPIDFNSYYGSTVFPSGNAVGTPYRAVTNTTGNSVTLTNLSPGTYYNFIVSEYDEDGTPYYDYYTDILTGDVQTAAGTVPTITNMSPASGPVGTIVTLTGTGFSTNTYDNIVLFGATKATVTAASATSLTVVVPYGATYSPVSVGVYGLTGTYSKEFIVTSSCSSTINSGSFTSSTVSIGGVSYETVVRDFNNDGKTDIVAPINPGSVVNALAGNSINGTNPPTFNNVAYTTALYPYHSGVADFDGDNKPDVVSTSTSSNLVSIITGTGSGFNYSPRLDIALPYQPSNVKWGDFDGDGRMDLAVAYNSTGTVISVFRNTGSIGFPSFSSRQDYSVGAVANCLYVRDFDLDGKADIAFGQSTTAAQFGILRSTGTPGVISFATQVNVATTTSAYVNAITTGDFNMDGKSDIAVALSNNTVRLYGNNCTVGTISFAYSAVLTTLSNTPVSITTGDLDGDGSPARPEIIVGYSSSNNVSVYEGTGNWGFAPRVDFTTAGSSSYGLSVGDFNEDGKADIVSSPLASSLNFLTNDMNALASEPTTAASNVTFSGQTQTALTLNFTAGNGFNRLVVARQGSSITNPPFDGVGYAANSIFGSGTDIGGNSYVVYNGSGNSVTVTGLQSNTYYYFAVYEYNSNGSACTNNYLLNAAVANTATLNAPPTLTAIANPAAICQNSGLQTVNMTGIGTGAVNETQTLTVTASSNNTALIPNPTVSYTSPNAIGSLSYTPVAGQYGTAVITVTVNDNASNNNTVQRTFTVTVTQMPSVSNAGPDQQICISTATLGATAPTVGVGTWSIVYTSNPSITTANLGNVNVGNTTLSGLNAGDTVNLAWTVTSGGCTASIDYVGIHRGTCPLTAGFTWAPATICATPSQINNISFTDASFAPSSTITSWSWLFAGPTTPNPSVSSQQNPANIQFTGPGTFTVTLTVNDNVGGNSSVTHYIVINPYPAAAGTITGPVTAVCQGATNVPFSVGAIANANTYNWTLPPGASIVSGSGTANILVNFSNAATSGSVQVYGQNSCGVGAASVPFNVTVSPLPGATSSISGPMTVCQGQTGVTFSTPSIANATSYSWTLPLGATITSNPALASITVDFAANASGGTIDVIGVNSCGNGTSSVGNTITVNPLPDPAGSITGSAVVCQGTTNVSYSISTLNNANSYTWTLPPGAVITAGAGTNAILVDFTNATGSGTVTVSGTNSCGNGTSASLPVTVGLLPDSATAITGQATVCAGSIGVQYSVTAIPNASSYNWTLPPGATIVNNNGNAITVNYSVNATSGQVSVVGVNSCGSGVAGVPVNVTVNPLPDSTSTVSCPASVCQGQTGVTISVGSGANTTDYLWTLPIGATITAGDSTTSITVDFGTSAQSGNVIVIGSNACGTGGATDTVALVVNPLPDAASTISGPATIGICPQSTGITFSVPSVNNATSYTWSLPSGATITSGANTNTITVDFAVNAQSGAVSVYGVNSCGQGAPSTMTINVDEVTPVEICMATVDGNSQYNQVMWDKPLVTGIDSFRIYREITTNNFVRVGAVHYDSLSLFVDSVYVPLADPNTTSFSYEISSVDSCGNESVLSAHHRTIFMQASVGIGGVANLSWNAYEGATVSFYEILRDSTNAGNWELIGSVPGTTYTYTDANPPVSVSVTDVRYKLRTNWVTSCNPTRNINTSESNLKDIPSIMFSVGEYDNAGEVHVYPNPSQGEITVEYPGSAKGYHFEVRDALGRIVYSEMSNGKNSGGSMNRQTLNLTQLAKGAYTLTLENDTQRIHKKIVIQ